MPRDLPTPQFRLRPIHALYLVDLAVAAVIFVIAGRIFMDHKGAAVLAAKEAERAKMHEAAELALAQADSAYAAQVARFQDMQQDSVRLVATYEQKRHALEAGFVDRQNLMANLDRLSGQVFNMRDRSHEASQRAQEYERDVSERRDEIEGLSERAAETDSALKSTRMQREQAAESLQVARETRTYEPVGLFPDKSSLAVRQEIGQNTDLTSFELQHVLQRRETVDLGVSLGVGLGTGGSTASSKQVGLLLSRELVHRRLGLDVSAGYSLLSDQTGTDESGAYAMAGLRYSPFYKERFHFGAGARAGHGEVMPYVGVTVGRR